MIPTIGDPPPKVGGKEIQSEEFQNRAFALLSIASMSGCCQVISVSHTLLLSVRGLDLPLSMYV